MKINAIATVLNNIDNKAEGCMQLTDKQLIKCKFMSNMDDNWYHFKGYGHQSSSEEDINIYTPVYSSLYEFVGFKSEDITLHTMQGNYPDYYVVLGENHLDNTPYVYIGLVEVENKYFIEVDVRTNRGATLNYSVLTSDDLLNIDKNTESLDYGFQFLVNGQIIIVIFTLEFGIVEKTLGGLKIWKDFSCIGDKFGNDVLNDFFYDNAYECEGNEDILGDYVVYNYLYEINSGYNLTDDDIYFILQDINDAFINTDGTPYVSQHYDYTSSTELSEEDLLKDIIDSVINNTTIDEDKEDDRPILKIKAADINRNIIGHIQYIFDTLEEYSRYIDE